MGKAIFLMLEGTKVILEHNFPELLPANIKERGILVDAIKPEQNSADMVLHYNQSKNEYFYTVRGK